MATEIPLKDAGKETAKIQRVDVTLPAPYKTGHVLRANEAEALNAYYVNCVRNAVAPTVKDIIDKAGGIESVKTADIQKAVDEFVARYDFGMGGGHVGDPVEREALEIGRNLVRDAIRRKGKNVSDFSAKDITAKARELVNHADHGPKIRKKAEEIVKSRETLADIDI